MKKINKNRFKVISFYRFIKLKNKFVLKNNLEKLLKNKNIKGTILLSNEGLNGSISGREEDLINILKFIKTFLKIRQLTLNSLDTDNHQFNRMKIRIKKEIVSLGQGNFNNLQKSNIYAGPKEWTKILKDKKIQVIDVRNEYEISVGKFKNSINPHTTSFREFPKSLKKIKVSKEDKIAMYCTGGIRCEKASTYLKSKGYKNIIQLKGGILNYLKSNDKKIINNNWKGECFVFDERVTINKKLKKGKYIQCYGCRMPLTKKDTLSKYYRKGVACPKCHDKRNKNQILRSITRQKQIEHAKREGIPNPFIKT